MKRKQLYITVLLFFLTAVALHAQTTRVIMGKVSERTTEGRQEPLPGANIVISDSQNRYLTGTTTNPNGDYTLRIPNEEGLNVIFSFIGMKSQKIAYTGQATINTVLESSEQVVQEVEVKGSRAVNQITGITERQQTAATQRVNMDEIMAFSPVTTIEEALQGQLAGVDIIASGDPGSRSSIRIRGTSTLNASAEPLIVIDGIPYSTDISEDFSFATANDEDYGQLLNISPQDIESIEVLKDAAATAIWGTKGGNGVLMITTKKGAKGKTIFSFSTKFTTRSEPDPIPMLNGNQYVALMQDAIWNTANAKGLATAATELSLLFDTPEINYMPDWRYFNEYNVNTDWLDEVKRTALTTDNNFSMSGGGDKAIYRFSLGYMSEQGTTIGTKVDRLTSTLNIFYNFSTRLRVDANFAFTATEKDANYSSGKSSWANVRSEALAKMPNKSPYWIDPVTLKRTNEYFSRQNNEEFQGAFTGQSNYNPVAMAREGYNITSQRESKITFRVNYTILPELTYEGWVSMTMNSTKNRKFLPQIATGVNGDSQYANRSTDALSDKFVLQSENKLLFRKNFSDKHNLIATGIFRTSQTQNSSYTSVISGTASGGLADPITGGKVQDKGSGSSETRSVTATFNAHYTLLDKYMLSVTVNSEGNSSLGMSERWGTFPALGLAWQAHEENFLRHYEWLDQAKIRLSYGQSGTSPSGSSPYVGTFESIGENYIDMSAVAPTRIQLNNLKWETSREYNIGVDLTFLQRRLNFTFDWYNKKTSDLLQKDVNVPSSTGYSSVKYLNSGEMTNNGLEFHANYEVFRNKEWRISVNANISRNVNEIVRLPENLNEETYSFGNGNYAQILKTGVPVGSFYGYKYLGVYQNTEETYARDAAGNVMHSMDGNPIVMHNGAYTAYPGDARYEDINHDGIINQYDMAYIGNGLPVLTGGGGFQVKYRDATLTATFHGRAGQKIINRGRMSSEAMYGRDNQSTATLRRWRHEGDNTDIPRALYAYGRNYLGSDRFVEKASYLRLQSLSLSYNVPAKIVQHWGMKNINCFITGYNLFTWTDYTGQDPEVKLPESAKGLVEDKSDTPISVRFSAGININF